MGARHPSLPHLHKPACPLFSTNDLKEETKMQKFTRHLVLFIALTSFYGCATAQVPNPDLEVVPGRTALRNVYWDYFVILQKVGPRFCCRGQYQGVHRCTKVCNVLVLRIIRVVIPPENSGWIPTYGQRNGSKILTFLGYGNFSFVEENGY